MEGLDRTTVCCFTGHRIISGAELPIVRKLLRVYIIQALDIGINTFVCGGAMGFDMMAGLMILKAKETHPDLRLVLVIPCKDQTARWKNREDIARYNQLCEAADELLIFNRPYDDECMKVRNQRMVDMSGACIAFLRPDPPDTKPKRSGTRQTVGMALKAKVPVWNLCAHPDWQ